jgi:hypothetical protein
MRSMMLGVVAAAGLTSAASAQLTSFVLNDGLFRYSEGTITGASTRTGAGGGTANFGFASGGGNLVTGDYLFQNWWWYRGGQDTREYGLSNQTQGIQLTPASVFVRYLEPGVDGGAANLQFDLTYTLNQISPTQAAVTINWNITNLATFAQNVSFFSYSDADIGSLSDDFANYVSGPGLNYMRVDASNADPSQFLTVGADLNLNNAWQMAAFTSTRLGLSDALVTNLPNSASPFTGDFTGALQWDLVLTAGESIGGRVTKGYNYVVPAPGALALLGLGGLAAARRRRA